MKDVFKQQAEWLNTWQDQQQKLTRQYASWGEDLTQGFLGSTKQQIPTNVEDLLKTQQELFDQFTKFGTDLQQNIQQIWGDKLPTELLQQFNFSILQEYYKSWLGNSSSISRDGDIGQSNYSAAKAGVAALTATWGKELARHGIRVGAIAPGFANTEMVQAIPEVVLDKLKAQIPLRRLAEPEEIAHSVRFIIENDYFTTRVIAIGGGMQVKKTRHK